MERDIENMVIPQHVALILDGNVLQGKVVSFGEEERSSENRRS